LFAKIKEEGAKIGAAPTTAAAAAAVAGDDTVTASTTSTVPSADAEKLAAIVANLKDRAGNALSSDDLDVRTTEKGALLASLTPADKLISGIKDATLADITTKLTEAGVEPEKIEKIKASIVVSENGQISSRFIQQMEEFAKLPGANQVLDARSASLLDNKEALAVFAGAIKSGVIAIN
jgi:hypothetical protein